MLAITLLDDADRRSRDSHTDGDLGTDRGECNERGQHVDDERVARMAAVVADEFTLKALRDPDPRRILGVVPGLPGAGLGLGDHDGVLSRVVIQSENARKEWNK